MIIKKLLLVTFTSLIIYSAQSQHSIAREWNEQLLEAIRNDYARPTVHARNLFHLSMAMYDVWAIFDQTAETVFLGKNFGGYFCEFDGIEMPLDVEEARKQAISFAAFRLLSHRFQNSPNATETLDALNLVFTQLGYDSTFTSLDYSTGSYRALGNYLANQIILFGLQDGSNEQYEYINQYYAPENEPLILELYEDNTGINPNKWQPLAFDVYIDQSGNPFPLNTPEFLSPEWGSVVPFSLKLEDLDIFNDTGFDCYVYDDPGAPYYILDSNENGIDDPYKWNFALVAAWSSHLDPNDNTIIDISPGSIGSFDFQDYPETFEEYKEFYDFVEGGDASNGHSINPFTGIPYTPQLVKRADYARVLAEFWADGPDSETPPGHWFTILNYVSDHPLTEKRFNGQGAILSDLEWDVKSYLTLGGAMHDAAINTWGIKGYYDYIRPISSIRYMAGKGQSSNMSLPNYDPHGLPLIDGYIELIQEGDPLAGTENENVDKIKLFSWKGPDYIEDPNTDIAGVDWILGEKWWPYQRATFVTPPFAGYVSGHSTFSRAAAEVLTQLTGDEFFPGGMGTFEIEENNFLVFEPGPSESLILQWATYRDASDQTSLSRIWGGIHPPIDDIRGRLIGEKIGNQAFNLANSYFDSSILNNNSYNNSDNVVSVYPNPFKNELNIKLIHKNKLESLEIISLDGKVVIKESFNGYNDLLLKTDFLSSGIYFIKFIDKNKRYLFTNKLIKI